MAVYGNKLRICCKSCAVLESLGDESSMEFRKERFNATDGDNDGWITYDDFLSVISQLITPLSHVPPNKTLESKLALHHLWWGIKMSAYPYL